MSSFDWNVIGGGGSGEAASASPQKISFLCKDSTVDDNIADNIPVIGPTIGKGSVLQRILATWREKKDSSPSDLTVRFSLKYLSGALHTVGMFTLPSSTALATTVQFTTFDWPTFPDRAVLLTDVTSSDGFKSANGVASFVLVYAGRGTGGATDVGLLDLRTYDGGTSYDTGDTVTGTGGIWRSLVDDNEGNPLVEGANWTLILSVTDGADGAPGADGADGAGVAAGGVAGDMLIKQSGTDFDTAWTPAPRSFPPETNKFLTGWADLTGEFSAAQPTEANLSLSDILTNNVSTSKHGLVPKLPNDATLYLDGTGAWTAPAGTGSTPPTVIYSFLTEADGTLIYDGGVPILDAYTL